MKQSPFSLIYEGIKWQVLILHLQSKSLTIITQYYTTETVYILEKGALQDESLSLNRFDYTAQILNHSIVYHVDWVVVLILGPKTV